MPVNYRDVEMLNNSMQNMGNSFRQSRLDTEATRQRSIDNSLRERQLKSIDDDRIERRKDYDLAKAFRELDQHGRNIKDQMDMLAEQARAKKARGEDGQSWASQQFSAALEALPNGELREKLKAQFKPQLDGGFDWYAQDAPKQPGQMETADTRNHAQTQALKAKVKNAKTEAERVEAQAELDEWQSRHEIIPTVTEEHGAQTIDADVTPEVPSVPEKGKWNPFVANTPAIPGKPAVTNSPARTIPAYTLKRKATPEELAAMPSVGRTPTAPQPGTNAPMPAPRNPAQRVANTIYETPKGLFKWTGTGWLPVK